jgi:hypothetical protein
MRLNKRTIKRALTVAVILSFLFCPSTVRAESRPVLAVGRFSAEKVHDVLPSHWEPFYFKGVDRHTEYRLVEEDRQVVVRASSDASASGLTRKIAIDPRKYPVVQWRWKVANVLKRADIHRKEGDDYPARITIVFEYDSSKLSFSEKVKYEVARMLYGDYLPLATLNYVWCSNAPAGLVVPNPYTE